MTTITIKYTTGVYTHAGWRSETVTAQAAKISDKRARVTEVIDVGENGNTGYASITGAKRQQYSVGAVAGREVGKIKNLSSCGIVNPQAAA